MKDPNWQKCVLHGDSKDIIKKIPDAAIDFILTDPPYNIGMHSTGNIPLPGRTPMNNDVAQWDHVDFNPEEWVDDFIRILKPTGNLFIFTSYNQIGRWHQALDHRFDTTNFMVWHKTNPAPKIFKAGFLNSCELIFTCWNKQHTWHFISQKEMHNFIESPICMRPERLNNPKHPAQKPVSILRKMIAIASNEGDIVFDPFMGVGSTGVAALELNRRFIGVELDADYFKAARERLEKVIETQQKQLNMKKYDKPREEETCGVCELETRHSAYTQQLEIFFGHAYATPKQQKEGYDTTSYRQSNLSPILKWPGGKEKELKYIYPHLPSFQRFFEPFVGGGSVFMGIQAEAYFINDFSQELIALYRNIATTDETFFAYVAAIDGAWQRAKQFFLANRSLIETYISYRNQNIDEEMLKAWINHFCHERATSITEILGTEFASRPSVFIDELKKNLFRKMKRMRELENQKHLLPEKDLYDNIETAIKSALYMDFRYLYNQSSLKKTTPKLHNALFFYIRNYAYSGMFRYSSKGEFNVPYGGIAYNNKTMEKKLSYYRSKELLHHFDKTKIYNLDFEEFLQQSAPQADDFIFLDPPYDSEFSTYAQNDFTQEDQMRLAHYLLHSCKARWMMIIKYTDFIYQLYHQEGIQIRTFDKEYLVSFMNRNDKKVTHLLITNY